MTRLMEKAFEKARELPEDEQDAIASIILREIESEHRWDELFSQPMSVKEMSGNNLKVSGIINLPSLGSLSGGKLLCPEQYIEGFASVPVRIVENRPRVPLLNSIEPSIGWSHPLTKESDACSLPTWQANLVEEPSNT